MFKDAFKKLDRKETEKILSVINPLVAGGTYDAGKTTILAYKTPFYPGHRLLNVADYDVMPTKHRYIIYGENQTAFLTGGNDVIYKLNEEVPVFLDEETAPAYISFFFRYAASTSGPFQIVEQVDDLPWQDELPAAARRAVSSAMVPFRQIESEKDGFLFNATLLFDGSLFTADIAIDKKGFVQLQKEQLALENLPVFDRLLEASS